MAALVVVTSPIHSAVMADGRGSTDLSEPLLPDRVRERQVVIDVERGPYQNGVRDHPSDGEEIDDGNPFEMVGAAPLSLRPANPVDPFRNDTPTWGGVYEWVKVVVCAPLVAVRLVLFGLAIAVGFMATKLALEGWKDKQSPMPAWRSRIMWVTRFCARCILFAFGYHWIKRVGKPAPREVAPIVVSNHISYVEPIFFFYELFPTIVASESHDGIPFVGTIIRAMQVIYVDRFSAPSRKNAVNEIKRKASCNNFPRVLLFPEGTTTNGRFLLSFQLGAFIPGFPVQPVIVRYPHVHFDQSWGNISLAKLMFRMFTQFHNFMEVEYLPVIVPVDSKQKNAVQFAEQTGYAMAHALNAVQTSYSYGDMMLLTRASQFTKDSSIYMVEMAWAERSFNISTSEALEFLDQFFAMNPDASGRVELHNFLTSMGLSLNPLTKKIFGFFDVEKKGSITFRQFLVGSAYIRKQPLFWRTCEEAFGMCNSEGTGYISVEQLTSIIEPVTSGTRDEILDRLFQLVDTDTNNDGSVSREAFLACLRRNPLLIAILVTCLKNTNSLEAL